MIQQAVRTCHEIAKEKGFWLAREHMPKPLAVAVALALVHSEASEALEVARSTPKNATIDTEALGEELADICIRVFDLAGWFSLDLEGIILSKIVKNRNRPPMHGKAF